MHIESTATTCDMESSATAASARMAATNDAAPVPVPAVPAAPSPPMSEHEVAEMSAGDGEKTVASAVESASTFSPMQKMEEEALRLSHERRQTFPELELGQLLLVEEENAAAAAAAASDNSTSPSTAPHITSALRERLALSLMEREKLEKKTLQQSQQIEEMERSHSVELERSRSHASLAAAAAAGASSSSSSACLRCAELTREKAEWEKARWVLETNCHTLEEENGLLTTQLQEAQAAHQAEVQHLREQISGLQAQVKATVDRNLKQVLRSPARPSATPLNTPVPVPSSRTAAAADASFGLEVLPEEEDELEQGADAANSVDNDDDGENGWGASHSQVHSTGGGGSDTRADGLVATQQYAHTVPWNHKPVRLESASDNDDDEQEQEQALHMSHLAEHWEHGQSAQQQQQQQQHELEPEEVWDLAELSSSQLRVRVLELTEELRLSQERLSFTEHQLEESQRDLQSAETSLANVSSKMSGAVRALIEQNRELEDTFRQPGREQYQRQVAGLQEALAQNEARAQTAEAQKEQLQQELAEATAELTHVNHLHSQLRQEATKLAEENTQLRDQAAEAQERVRQLDMQVEELEAQARRHEEEHAITSEELSRLQRRVSFGDDTNAHRMEQLERALRERDVALEQAAEELEHLRHDKGRMQSSLSGLKARIEEHERDTAEMVSVLQKRLRVLVARERAREEQDHLNRSGGSTNDDPYSGGDIDGGGGGQNSSLRDLVTPTTPSAHMLLKQARSRPSSTRRSDGRQSNSYSLSPSPSRSPHASASDYLSPNDARANVGRNGGTVGVAVRAVTSSTSDMNGSQNGGLVHMDDTRVSIPREAASVTPASPTKLFSDQSVQNLLQELEAEQRRQEALEEQLSHSSSIRGSASSTPYTTPPRLRPQAQQKQ